MLRLVHNQTVAGGLLINDIDDGLPNKTARRGVGDPKTYQRDGYANKAKQPCYVPLSDSAGNAGHIDVLETDHVLLSYQKGTIAGFANAGLLTVISFQPTDILAPTVASAAIASNTITITGTDLTSVAPYTTSVIFTGTGAQTLTAAQIVTAGGTVTQTSITIPTSAATGVTTGAVSSVQVKANNQTSTPAVAIP